MKILSRDDTALAACLRVVGSHASVGIIHVVAFILCTSEGVFFVKMESMMSGTRLVHVDY